MIDIGLKFSLCLSFYGKCETFQILSDYLGQWLLYMIAPISPSLIYSKAKYIHIFTYQPTTYKYNKKNKIPTSSVINSQTCSYVNIDRTLTFSMKCSFYWFFPFPRHGRPTIWMSGHSFVRSFGIRHVILLKGWNEFRLKDRIWYKLCFL